MDNNTNTAPTNNTIGGTGQLRINVYRGSINLPADRANVRITDPVTGRVLAEAQTNTQGKSETFELPTPPLEYSMEFGQPRPFNQYNVTISFPDYQDASIEHVQLYPTSTAIQNVFLVPAFQEILIPYPTLWGTFPPKIPEAEVKKLPFPSNLVVLPEPVVPSLIIVHAGRPDDASAPNYTVGFRDYVKNVASSEIYATWPREALKANIIAIISFTLNRVYTEWYRGKGFDFTITNSTAYDQSFHYGRNIFQEISDVVEEVFTTYVTRGDMIQPLFTQYCDGKRVKREGWLSQWGSKALGDQGYSALQILKNYYGYDISLNEAKKVEGIPISFPGVLKEGSQGENVRVIQNQLNSISQNYPLIPKLVEDGNYGERTAEAVKTFQQVFDLPATGEVNFPTWYAISNIFVAVNKL